MVGIIGWFLCGLALGWSVRTLVVNSRLKRLLAARSDTKNEWRLGVIDAALVNLGDREVFKDPEVARLDALKARLR